MDQIAPLRILHCLWDGRIGGAEQAVFQLVRRQLLDPNLAPGIAFGKQGGLYWAKTHQLNCPVLDFDLRNAHRIDRIPEMAQQMREFDIHHFHVAEPTMILASLGCPNSRRIYTHRGGYLHYPPTRKLRYLIVGLLLRFFFHGFSGNTRHGAYCAAKHCHLPLDWFRVTYNGLEFDLLAAEHPRNSVRNQLGLDSSRYVVGTVANLTPWKRVDRLLVAIAALNHKNITLLVIGDGIDRLRLESLAREFGIDDRVIFAGQKPNVADYLQIMDAFCLPGPESFGNAAVEAMAMGLPTIVFADGGGLLEHIRNEETGFIVASDLELAETLRTLKSDPSLGSRVGKRARTSVREHYSLEKSAAAYESMYQAVMGSKWHE